MQVITKRPALAASLTLVVVLLALFGRSLQRDQTLFSNDGPLGAISSDAAALPGGFFGAWNNLNWIGYALPSASPSFTSLLDLIIGPLLFSKFYVPIALLALGLSGWLLFRQLGLHPVVCLLGAVAITLNTDPFSYAAWGLASLTLSMAAFFLALAAVANPSARFAWAKAALAGAAIGMSIMEGFDNGAIFSLYLAAFTVFQAWLSPEQTPGSRIGRGVARVVVVAVCAAFVSSHTLSTLIGTQVVGVAGMAQDEKTKQERWDWATQWSLPKIESLRVVVPGLFGYRMTDDAGQTYEGSYWGSVGQQPGVPASRHSGSGVYGGVLVAMAAFFGIAASFKRRGLYSEAERRSIWFWTGAAVISLLLAWGRHAPFYQLVYQLPFFSTIRNPIKFMHPFHVAWVILFAYGVQGLLRIAGERDGRAGSVLDAVRKWWSGTREFEHRWTGWALGICGIAVLGWLLYAATRSELIAYLQRVGFDPESAGQIARFSAAEVAWTIIFLLLSVAAIVLVLSGALSGPRLKWVPVVLGLVLVADLVRANLPWVVYYDYKEKYASSPVLDLIRQFGAEGRITGKLMPLHPQYLSSEQAPFFPGLYEGWLQHLFQYYNVQSLDIIQMPRTPELDQAFLMGMAPRSAAEFSRITRLWELTNTRWLFGQRAFLEMLNQQLDPARKPFALRTPFNFTAKPGNEGRSGLRLEDITTAIDTNGQFAIYEFTRALPRVKFFPQWRVSTNDTETLDQLRSLEFDPGRTVLIASEVPQSPGAPSTNNAAGDARIVSYRPKEVVVEANAAVPGILLLNDRFDPDWRVTVDDKPAELLRANFIMRGVYLPAGAHRVVFQYRPPTAPFFTSLIGIALALALAGFVVAESRSKTPRGASASTESGPSKNPGENPPRKPSNSGRP